MAKNVIYKSPKKGLINSWTSIRNQAQLSGIYEEDVYSQLAQENDPIKAQSYLSMLAVNGDALKSQLPQQYDTYEAESKYSMLVGLSNIINYNNNQEAIDIQAQNNEFKNQFGNNENWVNNYVNDKLGGDYSKFNQQFKDTESLSSIYDEGYFADSELSSEDITKAYNDFSTAYSSFMDSYTPKEYTDYATILKNIDDYDTQLKAQKAYEDMSTATKVWSTIGQVLTSIVTTPIEMVEGIIDGVSYGIATIAEIRDDYTTAEEVRAFADKDIIPTSVWLTDMFEYSYATNPYATGVGQKIGSMSLGIVQSISQVVTMVGLNALVPGVGTGVYYASMAGQTASEYSLENPDRSMTNIFAYASLKTALSYAIEGLSPSDAFKQNFAPKIWRKLHGKANAPVKILMEAIGEGGEEFAEEFIGTYAIDMWFNPDEGIPSLGDTAVRSAEAALAGAISGAFLAGGHIALRRHAINKSTLKLVSDIDGSNTTLNANEMLLLSTYFKKLDDKVNANKKLSKKDQANYDKLKNYKFEIYENTGTFRTSIVGALNTDTNIVQNTTSNYGIVDYDYSNYDEEFVTSKPVEVAESTVIQAVDDYNNTISSDIGIDVSTNTGAEEISSIDDYLARVKAESTSTNTVQTVTSTEYTGNSINATLTDPKLASTKRSAQELNKTRKELSSKASKKRSVKLNTTLSASEVNTISSQATTETGITLSELTAYLTPDKFSDAIQTFGKYSQKIVDDLMDRVDYNEQITKLSKSEADRLTTLGKKVSEVFGSDIVIEPYTELKSSIGDNTYLYYSSNRKLPVVFEYNGNVYLSAAAAKLFSTSKIAQLLLATKQVYYLYDTAIADSIVNDILDEYVKAAELNAKNTDYIKIAKQQALFTALFVENSKLGAKLFMTRKSEYKKMVDTIRTQVSGYDSVDMTTVNSLTAIAERNLYTQCVNRIFESEQTEALRQLSSVLGNQSTFFKSDADIEQFIANIKTENPNAFRFMTFKSDINLDASDLALAIEFFAKQFGYKIPKNANTLTLFEIAKGLFKQSNYTNIEALNSYLNQFKAFEGAQNAGFENLLNYFLISNFGFCVTVDNKILHTRRLEEMISIDSLMARIKSTDFEPFLLSTVLTTAGKQFLGPALQNSDIVIMPATLQRGLGTTNYFAGRKISNFVYINTSKNNGKLGTTEHEILHAISNISGITMPINQKGFAIAIENIANEFKRAGKLNEFIDLATDAINILSSNLPERIAQRDGITSEDIRDTIAKVKNKVTNGKLSKESFRMLIDKLSQAFYIVGYRNELVANSSMQGIVGYNTVDVKHVYDSSVNDYTRKTAIFEVHSDIPFLKLLNGRTYTYDANSTETYNKRIADLKSRTITKDQALISLIKSGAFVENTDITSNGSDSEADLGDLGKAFSEDFKDKDITQLISKKFWMSVVKDQELSYVISKMSTQDFINFVSNVTGKEISVLKKAVKEAGAAKTAMNLMNVPFVVGTDYTAALCNGIKPRNLSVPDNAYTLYGDKITGIVRYNAASKSCSICLDNLMIGPATKQTLNDIINNTQPGSRLYLAGTRKFINKNAAFDYINKSIDYYSGNSDSVTNANFTAVFSKLKTQSIMGYKQAYPYDTIFVTNDGKIYNFDSKGKLIDQIEDILLSLGISDSFMGEYTVNVDTGDIDTDINGLTPRLTQLFTENGIAIFRKQGSTWTSTGRFNILQDRFANTISAKINPTNAFVKLRSGVAIVQDPKTLEVKIVQRNDDGRFEGTEVPWKKNKWYDSICNIMTEYQITEFSQLSQLGFSQEFIDKLANYTGTKTKYYGLTHSDILTYINDDTNTSFSRNLLISHCPDSYSNSLDWKRNGYITNVSEADQFVSTFNTYFAVMEYANQLLQSNSYPNKNKLLNMLSKVYSNETELMTDWNSFMQAIKQDNSYIGTANEIADTINNRRSSLITDLLNLDAQKTLKFANGVNLSYNSFAYVYALIKKGWGLNMQVMGTDLEVSNKNETGTVSILDKISKIKFDSEIGADAKGYISEIEGTIADIESMNSDAEKLNSYDKLLDRLEEIDSESLDTINTDQYANIILNRMDELQGISVNKTDDASKKISKIKEYSDNIKTLNPTEKAQARANLETEFQEFVNMRVRNIRKYGYEGYNKIRKAYDSLGASSRVNISSNISKKVKGFSKRITNAVNDGSITQTQADKLNSSMNLLQSVYRGLLSVPVDFTYNGLTQYDAINESVNIIDEYLSGENIKTKLKKLLNFIDMAAINTPRTLNEKTQRIDSKFRFTVEQQRYLYLLESSLKGATNQQKLDVYLDILNSDTSELGRPVVAILQDEVRKLSDIVSDVEEDIDFSKLKDSLKSAGINVTTETPTKRKKYTQESLTALEASRSVVRALSTQKRHADLLNDSTPATDTAMQEATKTAYQKVMNYDFVTVVDHLRKDAVDFYKDHFSTEYETLKAYRKGEITLTSNEYESLIAHRRQTIDSYIETYSKTYKDRYETVHRSFDNLLEFKGNPIAAKISTGLHIAYARFIYGPKTQANIQQFLSEVDLVLSERKINQVIAGNSTKRNTKDYITLAESTSDPEASAILRTLREGKYLDRSQVFAEELGKVTQQMTEAQNLINAVTGNYDGDIEKALAKRITEVEKTIDTVTSDLSQGTKLTEYRTIRLEAKLKSAKEELSRLKDLQAGTAQLAENIISDEPKPKDIDIDSIDALTDDSEADIDFTKLADDDIDNIFTDDADTIKQINKTTNKPERTHDEMYKSAAYSSESPLMDANADEMLRFIPEKTRTIIENSKEKTITVASTEEFLKYNADKLNKFLADYTAVKNFIAWYKKSPNLSIDKQTNAMIILSQISANLMIKADLRAEASELINKARRAAGRQLSLARGEGMTPVDELGMLAEQDLPLTDADRAELAKISAAQKLAIKNNDYKAIDQAMTDALTVLSKYSNHLDRKVNVFEKGLTQEEKAVRWHNLAQRITSWRYFAMLSAPATFFSRNVAGNALITVMDKVSSKVGTLFGKLQDRFSKNKDGTPRYKQTNNKASNKAKSAVNSQLVDSGLLDSILAGTVSKYDTGYSTSKNKLKKLILGSKKTGDSNLDVMDTDDTNLLSDTLNERTPFGNSKVGQVLNTMYNKIFGIMDKYDKVFMRKYMINLVTQVVYDNYTDADYAALEAGDKNAIRKFQDIVAYAQDEALRTYFRYQGKTYTALMRLLDGHPAAKAVFATIFPFPRMLLNTMSTALSYSPIGFIKAAMTMKSDDTVFKNLKVSKQLGQAAVGTVAMAIGAILTALGAIRFDDEDKYSGPKLVFFDALEISLEDLAPTAIPFIVGASFTDGLTGSLWDGITNSANALLETTIIGDLINTFGGNKNALDVVSNTFSVYVNQFMPAVVRHVTRLLDPTQKKYSSNGGIKVLQKIAAQIPLLSYVVPAKVDNYTGNDETYYSDSGNKFLAALMVALNAVLPAKISLNNPSELEIESKANDAATTGPSKKYTIDGVEYTLSTKEYREYQKLRAKLYNEYAQELIKTPKYAKMTNVQKQKELKKLQSKATEEARKQLKIG